MASASSSSLNTAPYTPVADKSVRFSPASNSFDSSTNSTVFTSHGSNRHIVGMGGTLKTEIEEKQKLEKENFDLKLKIYHLEESLRQLSSGEVNSEVLDLQSEVTHLRHQLQEHRIDLEHRNTLLIKAKGVIETLKGEMMVMKEQLDKKSTQEVHLHHQLQNVTHERDSYDESLQHRIDLLEEENSSLKQTNLENSQTLHQCRIQINELESSLNLTKLTLSEVTTQKDGLQERCSGLKQKLDQLETELVELRTEKDMWGLQGSEYSEMVEILQAKNDELRHQLRLQSHDDEIKSHAVVKKYEDQLAQMKSAYEQEFNNLKERYQKTLAEVRDQMRAAHSEEINELKSQGFGENFRMKEELLTRIHEKAEEVISLRGVVDMERSRVESLTKELFIIREELKTTSQNLIQKEKKLVDLEMSATANQQSALKTSELLTKTTEECKLLQYQLQEKNHQLEQLRHDHKEYEAKYSGVLKDLQTLQSEYEYCKSLMGNMQETYRENERFSHQIQQLKSEYDLLASQDNSKEKQLHLLTMELEKKEKTLSDLTTEKKEIAGRYEKLIYDLQAKENDLRVERDQHLQLESALAEQRNITSTLQKELDSLRNLTQKDDLRWNQNENLLKNQRNEMERVCGLFFQAVVKWDQILSGTLEVFEASNSSQHGSHGASTAGYDGKSFLRNGGYPSHGFLYSSSLPPSPETSEDLLPSSLILIERVQGKLERVDKIRSLFEKKTKELLSSMTIRVSHSDDRIEILSHKTSALQLQLQTVITQILHEKKIRDQSYQDLKTLQESVLKGHHDQLREHEARATELHLLYQTEKNKVSTLNHEISVLSEEVKIQQEELSKLHEAEEMLHQLSNQLTSITEANRQLSHESEEKSQRINDQCEDILRFKQENESHRANLAKLTSQIEVRDKMLTEQESLISSLKVEMQRLQQRQIHPELEKSIKESQDILKYSLGRLGSDQIQQAQPQPVPSLSSSSQVSKLVNENFVHLVDRLASLCQLTSQLVDETTHAWKSFDERYQLELGVRGHLSLSKPTSVSTEIEQSIYDLLNSNAKLSLQLQGVVNDFKRYVNDQETFSSRASEEPSILSTLQTTPAPLRSSQYPSTPLFSAIKDQSKLLASDLRIESYPASPLSHSLPFAARKEMSLPQTSSQTEHIRVQFQLPDTQHRQFRNHESTTPSSTSNQHGDRWGESTSRVSARSGVHRTDSVDDGWGTRSKLLFETREDDHYPSHYPSTPPSQIHQPKSTHSSSRRTVHLFGTESSSSISTPARQSTSRLTKLGQDLQNLANRLDQFDAKSRK